MMFVTLSSSAIESVGYNAATGTMEVTFVHGRTYTLTGVPEYHFEGICNAASPGGYWNEHLKGNY